jgi:hypothetical protein
MESFTKAIKNIDNKDPSKILIMNEDRTNAIIKTRNLRKKMRITVKEWDLMLLSYKDYIYKYPETLITHKQHDNHRQSIRRKILLYFKRNNIISPEQL